jgi:enoyl-CoA hydratase/carnithine racemase
VNRYQDILYRIDGRIATITLNRPEKLNAWTATMQQELREAVMAAEDDPAVRVIVLTGAGRGFCAGADMNLLSSIDPQSPQTRSMASSGGETDAGAPAQLGPDVGGDYGGRFGYLIRCPKPVIAAINGLAAGLGLVIALYADLRFVAADARLTTSFSQRGLVAEHGISWLLPRLVGPAHALDLLLSARKFDAAEAERIGLANRVLPQEGFIEAVMDYAEQLANTVSPRSMAVIKAQLYKALGQSFNEALAVGDEEMAKSFGSEDFKEGVAHFVEKRPPAFSGR